MSQSEIHDKDAVLYQYLQEIRGLGRRAEALYIESGLDAFKELNHLATCLDAFLIDTYRQSADLDTLKRTLSLALDDLAQKLLSAAADYR